MITAVVRKPTVQRERWSCRKLTRVVLEVITSASPSDHSATRATWAHLGGRHCDATVGIGRYRISAVTVAREYDDQIPLHGCAGGRGDTHLRLDATDDDGGSGAIAEKRLQAGARERIVISLPNDLLIGQRLDR
jgi:hypothetical protein